MATTAPAADWSGGVSPFGVSWRKMMMWWFIVTDALLFAGFLASYGVTRLAADSWPGYTDQVHYAEPPSWVQWEHEEREATGSAILAQLKGDA